MHAHTYSVSLSLSLSVSVSLSVSLSVSNVASVNSAKVAFWFGQNINSKRYCGDLVEGTLFLIILSNYAQNYIIIIPPPPLLGYLCINAVASYPIQGTCPTATSTLKWHP